MHKEAGGKRRGRSDSQSSGKKEKSSFNGVKKLFHGFPFTGGMHPQEPLSDTHSRFESSNFHKHFVCVWCSRILPEKPESRKKKSRLKALVKWDGEVQKQARDFSNHMEIFRQS